MNSNTLIINFLEILEIVTSAIKSTSKCPFLIIQRLYHPKHCVQCSADTTILIPRIHIDTDTRLMIHTVNNTDTDQTSISILVYIWSNMLYLEIFIKICGIFKILILLPFFIKSFIWAVKCPKPLPIHWKVLKWGVFFKLLFSGCALNAQIRVFFKLSKIQCFLLLYYSACKKAIAMVFIWGDKAYPATRFEYKTASERYLVA